MKRKQEARWVISDLQTIDICGHSRLCEGPHNLSFITRELCADAVVFQFFLSCWWRALPKRQSATSEPTILRVLSVRMVLTVKFCKVSVLSCRFLVIFCSSIWSCWWPPPLRRVWSAVKPSLVFLLQTDFGKMKFIWRRDEDKEWRNGWGHARSVCLRLMEKSNSCWGHDPWTWMSAACFILHIWWICSHKSPSLTHSDTQSLWHTQTLTLVLSLSLHL